jgi:hypothetical protein
MIDPALVEIFAQPVIWLFFVVIVCLLASAAVEEFRQGGRS